MKNCQPSPARYGLPTLVGYNGHDIRKTRMPAFSLGLRTKQNYRNDSPGPNHYGLPSIIGGKDQTVERAPAHSIHSKFGIKDHIAGPGPNRYGLQNFKPGTRAPAYSMGARFPDIFGTQECWTILLCGNDQINVKYHRKLLRMQIKSLVNTL